ncbi:MAG: ABC transporter substrate-binding protein [Lachnospiraceae bacterium]|nr:ABC transporter substrate-binding protein [Lachnospiraceae bacterium]
MKKKALALLMATAMSATMLAGCGSDGNDTAADSAASTDNASQDAASEEAADSAETEAGDTAEAPSADKVYNIGICQLLEHPALDEATRGFEEAVKELFGENNVNIDFQNAQGEQANCATICTQFVTDGDDLILANATSPLQSAAAATNTIPILGTSITDYATALDISDWTGATGTNVSGTSDLAPLEEQEKMLLELFPDVQKVGILYCSAEANSKYQADVIKGCLEADGIAYEEYTAADSNEIQSVVTSACESCDVLYIPTDNTMAGATEVINNVALPAGVPIIAGEEGICAGCGVATLSISYYDIGYAAGEMAYDILVNGADISTMEIKYAPQVTKEYNASICETLGIEIPDDYVAIATE